MRVMSLGTIKSCLLPYIAVGWTGYVPSACENTQLHIAEKYAPYMWGFPNKFFKQNGGLPTQESSLFRRATLMYCMIAVLTTNKSAYLMNLRFIVLYLCFVICFLE